MAQIPPAIKKTLTDYINSISIEIDIQSAILFGSYAQGNWNKESDIDIAIFSADFSNMDRIEAISFLLGKAYMYNLDIQPLAYDDQDLIHEHENPFIHSIVSTGIELKKQETN